MAQVSSTNYGAWQGKPNRQSYMTFEVNSEISVNWVFSSVQFCTLFVAVLA